MGFFNSYTKVGKGIDKDEDKPIRPIYFFQLFFRKISKMIQVNLIYILFTLPLWAFLFIFVQMLLTSGNDVLEANVFVETFIGSLQLFPLIFVVFCFLIGPATAGVTYVFICYATEMPVFTWMDFWDHFKKNFKQSTLLTALNGIAMTSTVLTWTQTNVSPVFAYIKIPSLVVMIVLIFLNFYAFPIMVLFKMKFIDIIKNSLIFALSKLPFNILTLAIIVGVSYAMMIQPFIGFFVLFLIGYSFCGFLTVFSVYPTIEKYMLIPAKDKDGDKSDKEIVSVFQD